MRKEIFKYILWALCATLWVAICFILPDFIDHPTDNLKTIFTIGLYITAISGASFGIIYLLGLNKYIACLTIPLLGGVGAAISYFRVAFHASITPIIIDATLHTNSGTIAGVVSWQLMVWVVINVIIAIGFILWRTRHIGLLQHKWIHALIAIVFVVLYYNAHWHLHSAINQHYPYNIVYNFIEYTSLKHTMEEYRIIPKYTTPQLHDSLTIVFVIGESARADHLQLNGYQRETTPRLSHRKNVISLSNVFSEHTRTSASLPHILTRADSVCNECQYTETSFVPIFRKERFYTAWISNQDMGTTYAPFLKECDTCFFVNIGKYIHWLDIELLASVNDISIPHHEKSLCILHTIGSHWYYNDHVTPEHYIFQPITTNRLITNNTIEQITNSYDNTIHYMDEFLDSLIMCFENSPTLIIYQADHGEALGESNQFLHANDVEAVKHPACIIWYSDKYAEIYPEKIKALIRNKDKRYRTDYVFYSILYAAGIEAEGDCPEMNIFR